MTISLRGREESVCVGVFPLHLIRWRGATLTGHDQLQLNVQNGAFGLGNTRTAAISLEDADRPIVAVRVFPQVQQSLEDAQANIAACIEAAGNRRCRLLIDIRKAEVISAEVRHYYSGDHLTQWIAALALLVEASPLGRVMGNLYLRIARLGVPTRLFEDEAAAMNWLRKESS